MNVNLKEARCVGAWSRRCTELGKRHLAGRSGEGGARSKHESRSIVAVCFSSE